MYPVVKPHGLLVQMRLQGIVIIRKRRQFVWHGSGSLRWEEQILPGLT